MTSEDDTETPEGRDISQRVAGGSLEAASGRSGPMTTGTVGFLAMNCWGMLSSGGSPEGTREVEDMRGGGDADDNNNGAVGRGWTGKEFNRVGVALEVISDEVTN